MISQAFKSFIDNFTAGSILGIIDRYHLEERIFRIQPNFKFKDTIILMFPGVSENPT